MGQAFKYGVLGAAIVGLIVAAGYAIASLNTGAVLGGFGSAIINFLNSCSAVVNNVRGCLNYICGSPIPFTVLIHVALVFPFVRFAILITSSVIHFINQ